jgi:hypothetical protein
LTAWQDRDMAHLETFPEDSDRALAATFEPIG